METNIKLTRLFGFLLLFGLSLQAGPNINVTLYNDGTCDLAYIRTEYSGDGSTWVYVGEGTWDSAHPDIQGPPTVAPSGGSPHTWTMYNVGGGTPGVGNGYNGTTVFRYAYSQNPSDPSKPIVYFTGISGNGTQSGTFSQTTYAHDTSCAGTCTTNFPVRLYNGDIVPHQFGIWKNSTLLNSDKANCTDANASGTAYVPAGQTLNFTVPLSYPCGTRATNPVIGLVHYGSDCTTISLMNQFTNSDGVIGSSYTQDMQTNGVLYVASNTNASSILWENKAYTDTPTAVRNAASAIKDSIDKGISQQHDDASSASQILSQIATNTSRTVGYSNVFVNNLTNGMDIPYLVDVNRNLTNANTSLSNIVVTSNGSAVSNAIISFATNTTALLKNIGGEYTNLLTLVSSNLNGNTWSALTNILSGVGDTNSDIASESTLRGISNLLSGFSNGTNAFGVISNQPMTNYAQETTLVGISNILSSLTNGPNSNTFDAQIDSQKSQGESAAQDGKNVLDELAGHVVQPSRDQRFGSPTENWKVMIPYMGNYEVNLDPFSYSWVNALAAFMRNLVAWIFAAGLYYRNVKLLLDTIQNLFTFRQTQTAGTSILGTNLNSVSCIIVSVVITTLTLAVPMYFSDWFGATALWTIINSHPFAASSANNGSALSCSVYIVDQFFPLAFMIWCVVVGIAFRASLTPLLWLVGTVIRFLSGV